jgi:hypothetical protein
LGNTLTPEQIYAIQSIQGNSMQMFANGVGSVVNGRLKTIDDPLTEADTFVLADKFDGEATAVFNFAAQQNVKAVVLSQDSPEDIEEL